MQYHNVLAIPQLLYGSETWVRSLNGKNEVPESNSHSARRDQFGNNSREELTITQSLNDEISGHKNHWLLHVERLETESSKAPLIIDRKRREVW